MGYIRMFFNDHVTETQRQIFDRALAEWNKILTGNTNEVSWRAASPFNINAFCNVDFTYNIGSGSDGLDIFVRIQPIDGPGSILGQAGPCLVQGVQPSVAVMTIDSEDIASEEANGRLFDVISHEIGHTVGIGTSSPFLDLMNGGNGNNPLFTGANAKIAYAEYGAAGDVPVQELQSAHWRESALGNELMTPFVSLGGNPMSRVTILALKDLGYIVDDTEPDSFKLPTSVTADKRVGSVEMVDDVLVFEQKDLATVLQISHESQEMKQQVVFGAIAGVFLVIAVIGAVMLKKAKKSQNLDGI
eukprot:snap_masked-scaffold_35-processed-gene-2.32-mRNA-1 protein AED:1.00 eAED:1.00 QI:0/-1/0/0/-1/1/1/0/301